MLLITISIKGLVLDDDDDDDNMRYHNIPFLQSTDMLFTKKKKTQIYTYTTSSVQIITKYFFSSSADGRLVYVRVTIHIPTQILYYINKVHMGVAWFDVLHYDYITT